MGEAALFARTCLLLALVLGLIGASAGARQWVQSPVSVPVCSGHAELELNCGLTACAGYGAGGAWADEVLVRFCMPETPFGGPWLVDFVAFFMSGTGSRQVFVRDPGQGACAISAQPGEILGTGWSFAPTSSTWPPGGWTIVDLGGAPPYSPVLLRGQDQGFCIGIELKAGDRIGLSAQPGLDGGGWGSYQGGWVYDSQVWSLTPAIRVGLTDLGLSHSEASTWGQVKGLFR